jgi:hypothetical protein
MQSELNVCSMSLGGPSVRDLGDRLLEHPNLTCLFKTGCVRAGVDERKESGISQTRLVHHCERGWDRARVGEGQTSDSAVWGSARSR